MILDIGDFILTSAFEYINVKTGIAVKTESVADSRAIHCSKLNSQNALDVVYFYIRNSIRIKVIRIGQTGDILKQRNPGKWHNGVIYLRSAPM